MTSTPGATWTNPFPTPVTNKTTYLAGFQYKDNRLEFFPHAEGYVKYQYSENSYSYVFNYTDHLGNVRVSYSDIDKNGLLGNERNIGNCRIETDRKGNPSTVCDIYITSAILEESHYYPFGLKHAGYNSNNAQPNYNYKYNGKELQTELGLNMYDYGARNYDATIGRWMNIDPLAEMYDKNSPYVYASNNPVYFIDPDGMKIGTALILKQNKNGEYLYPELAEAFLNFANSEAGIAILSKFAEAGQKIRDHTYTENGEYHNLGIDLVYSVSQNSAACLDCISKGNTGPNGSTAPKPYITRTKKKQERLKLTFYANKDLNTNNIHAKNYKEDRNNKEKNQIYTKQNWNNFSRNIHTCFVICRRLQR